MPVLHMHIVKSNSSTLNFEVRHAEGTLTKDDVYGFLSEPPTIDSLYALFVAHNMLLVAVRQSTDRRLSEIAQFRNDKN